MILVPNHHRQHPTAFQPSRTSSSPHSPVSTLSDRQIPRVALSTSSTADLDSALLGLGSAYSNLPMNQAFFSQSPALSIPQSTSALQVDSRPSQASWEGYGQLEASYPHRLASHRRNTSSSSIGSNASTSSSQAYSQSTYSLGHSEHSPLMAANKFDSFTSTTDDTTRSFSNNLPTPTYTPVQDTFAANFPTYSSQAPNLESTMAAHLALKQDVLDRNSVVEEDIPGFSHSARHSVSSFGNSPSTPHVDDIDDAFRAPSTAEMSRHSITTYDRPFNGNIKDDFGGGSTSPINMNVQSGQFQPQNQTFLSPFTQNPKLHDLLQKANKTRAQSPSSYAGRPLSPYRHGSPLVTPQGRLDTSVGQVAMGSPLRQQQAIRAFARQSQRQANNAEIPKTISPKDSLLDHTETEEVSKMPLFPETTSTDFAAQQRRPLDVANQYGNYTQNQFNEPTNWMTNQQSTAPASQPAFTFTAPPVEGNNRAMSFPVQSYRPVDGLTSAPEPTPDFPAHLTSMESSISEAAPEQAVSLPSESKEIKRPSSTLADAGTYSCTFHGCAHRFDTPQKLQKHKKDAHRQNPNGQQSASSPIGSNMSAADLLARNSQAGPHKCSRINPTTGKPCNTVFSRPYDLTRHEDTIHNNIKQKVRCAYCVEEKTFSRNDALTRHMRVVHSDVNFPGKHRRRGGD